MRYKNKNNLKRDVKILYELYRSRVLTINQLTERFTYKKSYMYKLVSSLFKSGLILTGDIKGFTNENGIRGRYYRISNKGIKFLKENGYDHLKYSAEDLMVSDVRVPIEITFNDIHYEMTNHGWEVLGSRESKVKYAINRTDNLSGVLSSPVLLKEYPFYIFQFHFEMSEQYIGRIISEINRYKFEDIVLFTTTKEMFEEVMNIMLNKVDIFTYKTFRVLPLQFGLQYLLNYTEDDTLFNFLEDEYDIYKVEKELGTLYEAEFDNIVLYEGEEYYLANFLDFNLVNYHRSKYYRREHYEKDGRKVLALVNDRLNYKELLRNVHHIDFLNIPAEELLDYLR